MAVEVRPAEPADEDGLATLDRACWTTLTSPVPPPGPDWTFGGPGTAPGDVLVALVDGDLAGYVRLLPATPLAASAHVLRMYKAAGFAVEGILRGEFLLDGAYVDDVFMALDLSDPGDPVS